MHAKHTTTRTHSPHTPQLVNVDVCITFLKSQADTITQQAATIAQLQRRIKDLQAQSLDPSKVMELHKEIADLKDKNKVQRQYIAQLMADNL